jgi:hypothetical protein
MEEIIFKIALYAGFLALLMFTVSFLTGYRIVKFPVKYRIHRRAGVTGFIALLLHGFVMSWFYFFT